MDLPFRFPDNPAFPPSGVMVPIIAAPSPPPPSSGSDSVQLNSREPWMLEGDPRTDAEADADWRQGTDNLFSSAAISGDKSSCQSGNTPFPPSSSVSSTNSGLAESSSTPRSGKDEPPLPDSLHPWPQSHNYGGQEGHPSFLIRLTFPDGERCDKNYSVSSRMTVRLLERRLAWLLRTPSTVFKFVHPRWEPFDHVGLITDRYFPGTSIRCPYLERVFLLRVTTRQVEDEERGEPKRPDLVDGRQGAKEAVIGDGDERPQKRPKGERVPPDHYSLDANQSRSAEDSMTSVSFLSSSPYSESKTSVICPNNEVMVSFRERKVLRKMFRMEHRRELRAYSAQMKADFEANIPPIDFANLTPPPTDENGNADPLHVSDAEMVADAFELFMGNRMQDYDATYAERSNMIESAISHGGCSFRHNRGRISLVVSHCHDVGSIAPSLF